jgi:hypothetical protein
MSCLSARRRSSPRLLGMDEILSTARSPDSTFRSRDLDGLSTLERDGLGHRPKTVYGMELRCRSEARVRPAGLSPIMALEGDILCCTVSSI